MDKTKHLETKFSIARYALIKLCEGDELRFYQYVKLYAINKNSAFPSQWAFKNDLGWSKYTTNRIATKMEKKNRLKVERNRGKNNIYDITWYDSVNIKGIKNEYLTESRRETLTTSRRETLTQTIRKETTNNVIIKSLNDDGTNDPAGLQKLATLKRRFQLKPMAGSAERTEIQERVGAEIRPSGK